MGKKEQKAQKENNKNKEQWDLQIFFAIVAMGLVLMAWLWVDRPSQAEIAVIAYAREQGISSSAYPDHMIALLERNPETEEFVLNYPFREELETDLSGYDRSQGVPLLMQWDKRWGYMPYGGGTVASGGSGPLCLAMAGYYITGDELFYPHRVVNFAMDMEYYSVGSGSRTELITEGGPALGLEVKAISAVEEKIAIYLQAGNPIIAVIGPGAFSSTSHFIVLTGYQDGQLTVNDPDSYVNSGKTWSFAEIQDQLQNLWVIKAAPAA